MREYDFKVKAVMTATVMVEAESAEEAARIANEMDYFPENAFVDSIDIFND